MTTAKSKTIIIGKDMGMGAIKLSSVDGGYQLPSQVAVNGSQKVSNLVGLASQKAPLHIRMAQGSFYVGAGAHDFKKSSTSRISDGFILFLASSRRAEATLSPNRAARLYQRYAFLRVWNDWSSASS